MTVAPIFEMAISVLTVLTAAVATFRAGSRGLYLLRNDGRIGVVDGPRILGPDDALREVAERRRRRDAAERLRRGMAKEGFVAEGGCGSDEGDDSTDIDRKCGEEDADELISPLWEPTYGFRRAVQFALDECVGREWDAAKERTRPGGLPSTTIPPSGGRERPVTVSRISPGDAGTAGQASPAYEAVAGLFSGAAAAATASSSSGQRSYSLSPYATYTKRGAVTTTVTTEGLAARADGGTVDAVTDDDDDRDASVSPSAAAVLRRGEGAATTEEGRRAESDDSNRPPRTRTAAAASAIRRAGAAVSSPVVSAATAAGAAAGTAASSVKGALLRRSGARGRGRSAFDGAGAGRGAWEIRIDDNGEEEDEENAADRDCGVAATTVVDIPSREPEDEEGRGTAAVPADTSSNANRTSDDAHDDGDGNGDGDGDDNGGGGEAPNRPRRRQRHRRRVARVTAYAPDTFAALRSRFGVSEEDYRRSMTGLGPYVSFQSNSKGAARVGGYFFFTPDGAYMVKTVKREEARTFLEMLPKYRRFMGCNSRRSLLTRFCGMYGVRVEDVSASAGASGGGEEHILLVMNAVFPAEGSEFISERFDLKGSTVGRECSAEERASRGSGAVLKDLDLAKEVEAERKAMSTEGPPRYGINVGARAKSALLSQLRRDVALLAECGVMDYSLLVGVVHADGQESPLLGASPLPGDCMAGSDGLSRGERRAICLLHALLLPLRTLAAPPAYLVCTLLVALQLTVSTFLTRPFPYYGAGICGVDGGALSVLHGRRHGGRAVYYVGVIDFLQPWTVRKVLERQMKGAMGYDTRAISCVDPGEYAERFLEFLDAHVT